MRYKEFDPPRRGGVTGGFFRALLAPLALGADFGTSFFGTAGGGLRISVTERVALRGDAVFSLWKLDTPPGFSDPERGFELVDESQWAGGLHLSVATVIRF